MTKMMWMLHVGLLAIVLPLILAAENNKLPDTLWGIRTITKTRSLTQSQDKKYSYIGNIIVRESPTYLSITESSTSVDGKLEYTKLDTLGNSWLGLNLDMINGIFFAKSTVCNYGVIYFEYLKDSKLWRPKIPVIGSRMPITSHRDIILVLPEVNMKEEYMNKYLCQLELYEFVKGLQQNIEKLAINISFKKLCLVSSMQVDENEENSSYFKRVAIWGPYTMGDKGLYNAKKYADEHILKPNLILTRPYHKSNPKVGCKGGLPLTYRKNGIRYTLITDPRTTFITILSEEGKDYVLPRMTKQQVALMVDPLKIDLAYDNLEFKDNIIRRVPVQNGQYILIVPTSCSGTLLGDKKQVLLNAVNEDNFEMVQNLVVTVASKAQVIDPIIIIQFAASGNIQMNS